MKKILLPVLLLLAAACSSRKTNGTTDNLEACEIAYSDIVGYIVTGYRCHWDECSPEDMYLSDVYRYESVCGAFARKDINGDGIEELLLGDDFGEGRYALYDIFTMNPKTGDIIHLMSGGERDNYVINGSGLIVERGSNSASDSFTKCYRIENLDAVEADGTDDDLMALDFDKFMRYVAPSALVALQGGETAGQLIKDCGDTYLVEIQDTVHIAKAGVEIELWSAFDGRGVVYPKDFGQAPVYSSADESSEVLGTIAYEEGSVPETCPCKGYAPAWFRIDYNGRDAFVPESLFEWDFVDRF